MPDPVLVYIALGANLDNPTQQIELAIQELDSLPDTRVLTCSRLYRSRPAGFKDQPDFVNAVACLETQLAPRGLLDRLLDLEHRHGRVRTFRNSPRTLDLDILLFGDLVLNEPNLHVPHPRMHERVFVLLPLSEIAPDSTIPGVGAVMDILAGLDKEGIQPIESSFLN